TIIASSGTPAFYGALVGFTVDLQGNVTVNYDSDLVDRLEEIGVAGIEFELKLQITGWEEL
ncbi:MAG: hypothetical protein ACE5JP_18130, partial [Candidatus Bipolaricaulia bacterium]